MKDPRFLPYGRQTIGDEDLEAVREVLRSDWLTQGPAVERFESALATRCGARHAVAVSNGTAALHLAALAAGIEPGRRVLTSPLTFVATANCVVYGGGVPGFVDVDPATVNLDPEALETELESPRGHEVRGVIPVHYAGCPADMRRIGRLARERGLFVIEDASHAIGSRWRDDEGTWRTVGSCSHSNMTVFSFHPVKTVTTGEGGAVLTGDDDLARRLRELRTHGIVRDRHSMKYPEHGPWYYEMQSLGFNYRLTDIQAALGLAQLDRLDAWVARRSAIVDRYRTALAGEPRIGVTVAPEWTEPAWHLFTVRVPNRARVYRALRERGIGVQVHYVPVHLQPYYRERLGTGEGDFPNAEAFYRETLSLPLYPGLTDEDVDRVVGELTAAVGAFS